MQIYRSRYRRLHGSSYKEIYPQAFKIYKVVQKNTKRQPYVRSSYFARDKVFLTYFWQHLRQKNDRDRVRRLRSLEAALDTIRNTRYAPTTKQNPKDTYELLHRFIGCTGDNQLFYIQIKENVVTKRKDLISIFPIN